MTDSRDLMRTAIAMTTAHQAGDTETAALLMMSLVDENGRDRDGNVVPVLLALIELNKLVIDAAAALTGSSPELVLQRIGAAFAATTDRPT